MEWNRMVLNDALLYYFDGTLPVIIFWWTLGLTLEKGKSLAKFEVATPSGQCLDEGMEEAATFFCI